MRKHPLVRLLFYSLKKSSRKYRSPHLKLSVASLAGDYFFYKYFWRLFSSIYCGGGDLITTLCGNGCFLLLANFCAIVLEFFVLKRNNRIFRGLRVFGRGLWALVYKNFCNYFLSLILFHWSFFLVDSSSLWVVFVYFLLFFLSYSIIVVFFHDALH